MIVKSLNEDKKLRRKQVYSEILEKIEGVMDCLKAVRLASRYDLVTEVESMQWKTPESWRPKKS